MKVPDGWKLVPIEPDRAMLRAAQGLTPIVSNRLPTLWDTPTLEQMGALYAGVLAAAPPPPVDQEIAAGITAEGLAGAMYRLLARCDYREVQGWLRGEIIRNTEQQTILDTAAAMVSSAVLQVAGMATRSMMRQVARAVMTMASEILEKDIQELGTAKKAETVLKNNIRIVPPAR